MKRVACFAVGCFTLGLMFSVASLNADEIGFIEKFALAKDREAVLKELIPGTEDYYYFHCLHYQNTEQFEKVDSMLNSWIKSHDYNYRAGQSLSRRAREIVNRQMLLTYAKDEKKTLEYLQRHLNLNFNHQRESLEGPSLPSVLDPVLIDRKTLTESALSQYSGIQGFEPSALAWLLDEKLDASDLYYTLAALQIPDHPRLVEMLNAHMSNDVHEFGRLGIHQQLTKQQLLQFVNLKPRLMNNGIFVNAYLSKIRPNPDVHFASNKDAQKAHLSELWDFVKRLSPSYNTLKAHVLYHRLVFDRTVGVYDRDRFMEYIQLPREANYIEPKYHRQSQFNSFKVNFNQDYQRQTLYGRIGNDEPLLRSYLSHFFIEDQDYKSLEKYLHYSYLKKVFAETKIVNGLGDREKWAAYISAVDYKNLRNRVDLDFAYTSRERYSPETPVSIEVDVKNVQKLIVKVFEINTSNFFRDQQREIDTNIELDGLLPNKEYTFEYSENPFLRVRRKFDFPELDKAGVYVIDFIGNRKSSRALVRKGRLRFIEQITPAGHELTIVNGKNEILNDASVWLMGTRYSAGKDGKINIPFSTSPGNVPIIISQGEFSSLDQFNHQAESYQLNTGFYVDRESLVAGEKAKVVVRPQMLVNGTPSSVKLLSDVRLIISSSDLDGAIATKEVKDFKLFEDRESEFEFSVPSRLQGLSFRLEGEVKNLSTGKDVNLASSDSFYVNAIDTTTKVEDLFLSRIDDEYYLDLMGKTGELRVGRPVRIELKHRDIKRPVTVNLQTNMKGRIKLGSLNDIVSVKVTGPESTTRTWNLSRKNHTYYATLHAVAGDPVEVPLAKYDRKLTHQDVALMEMRNGTYVKNHFSSTSLADGILRIKGLARGDYRLFLKNVQTIQLRVSKGDQLAGVVVNQNRQLELMKQKPIQIKAIDRTSKKTVLQLKNADAFSRVHVFATRFVPPFDVFQQLGLADMEPGLTILPQSQSLYVAGRKIGDEYQYILDRKYAEKYPGVMLQRPGLLLQPWAVRTTQTSRQDPNQGTKFRSADDSKPGSSSRKRSTVRSGQAKADRSSIDFLPEGSILLLNLEANEKGQIEIDNEILQGKQHLTICAVTPTGVATREFSVGETPLQPKDLRLVLGLDPDTRYARKKEVSFVDEDGEFKITDVATGEFELYDNLPNVYRLFTALTNDAKLAEFRFILGWNDLKMARKLELYSEYACHELNFFLLKKDREFFQAVVKPYIANKKDKTFLDHWLLGNDLMSFVDPWEYNRLNAVEKILLAQSIQTEGKFTQRFVNERYYLSPTTQARFDQLFGFALQGNALDTDTDSLSLSFEQARDNVKLAEKSQLGRLGDKQSGYANSSGGMPGAQSGASVTGGGLGGGGMGGGGGGGFGGRGGQPTPARNATKPSESRHYKESPAADDEMMEAEERDSDVSAWKKLDRLRRDQSKNGKDGLDYFDSGLQKRKALQQLFRQVDKTQEWAENNYYKLTINQQNSDLVKVNQFWRDYAANSADSAFYSVNVAEASGNFTEMMFALSVLDLQWKPTEHSNEVKDNILTLTANSPLLIYHDQIRPAKDGRKETSVLVSQNFFQVNDRYRYEGSDRLDKFVTDEFIKRTAYGCQVVVTNPTSAIQKIDLLLQIPKGAIPLNSTKRTRSVHQVLQPYRTASIEYSFYFPEPGDYEHYPVNVARNEEVIAFSEKQIFHVVDQPSKIDKTSWNYISQYGSEQEVLDYLAANNLQRTDLNKIAWRMKDADFFRQIMFTLSRNHVYNATLWAYGVHHNRAEVIEQFLEYQDAFVAATGPFIRSDLLVNDRVARHSYEHLEYKPLVNARAHQLGEKRQILNDRFYSQYDRLLWILACHRELNQTQRMALTYYLLLQDRVAEAKEFFEPVSRDAVATKVQYDYMAAYLDMFSDDPQLAGSLAAKYVDYKVDRWRKAFAEIGNQIREFRGDDIKLVDDENRNAVQDSLALKTPSFDFKVDAKTIELSFQNLKRVQVNYYVMDVELLFSRNPFVQEYSGELTYIRPRKSEWIDLPGAGATHKWSLPKELDRSNVLVEISGAQQVKTQAYYAHAMNVQMIDSYGQLKVTNAKTGRQIPKTYCKVYAQLRNGTTRFYKDGYTDLRGRFDYASLSTNDLDNVQRFSVLVMSDDLGATVREALPPKR